MTKELQIRAAILDSAELKQLLGRPPLLSGEDVKAYDEILARLLQSVPPEDFMEQVLIHQWAACNWEAMRYIRHKSLALERKSRELAEFQAKQAKVQAQKGDERARTSGNDQYPATELGHMFALEDKVEGVNDDVDAILEGPTAELKHAKALQFCVAYHLQLDQLLDAALMRRDESLQLLERYRRGLGKRVKKASEIIDAEFKDATSETEGATVPLVPSGEDQQ